MLMRKRTVVNLFRLTIALTVLIFYLGCRKEVDIQLSVDFDFIVADSNYNVPARISFENKTKGAQFYKWTFVNGNPGTSDYKNPGYILFNTPGTITVKLEAWNDRERKEKTIEIILDTIPKADFNPVPRINNISPTEWDFQFTCAVASLFMGNPSLPPKPALSNLFASNEMVKLSTENCQPPAEPLCSGRMFCA